MDAVVVRRLVWESWNVAHIAGHGVTPDEVEQVCHGSFIAGEARAGRLILIGPTNIGRMLAVIIDPGPEPDVYFAVSARPASRKERARYQQEGGSEPK